MASKVKFGIVKGIAFTSSSCQRKYCWCICTFSKDLLILAFTAAGALYDQYKEDLVRSLEIALTSPNIPPEVLQTLLNLAEYMEHDEKSLPIDIRTLANYAQKCHAYAKALHYKELEYMQDPKPIPLKHLLPSIIIYSSLIQLLAF